MKFWTLLGILLVGVGIFLYSQHMPTADIDISSLVLPVEVPHRLDLFTGSRGGYGEQHPKVCQLQGEGWLGNANDVSVYFGPTFALYQTILTLPEGSGSLVSYIDETYTLRTRVILAGESYNYQTSLQSTSTEARWFTTDGKVKESLPANHVATIAYKTDNFRHLKRVSAPERTCAPPSAVELNRFNATIAQLQATSFTTNLDKDQNSLQARLCTLCSQQSDQLLDAQCQVSLGCDRLIH